MSTVMDATSAVSSSSADSTAAANVMSNDDFLNVLLTQLANQDPLEPMDNNQLMDQMATIQSMQISTQLITSMELSQASGLIGKTVSGVSTDGLQVRGTVDSVTMAGSSVSLIVGGAKMPIANVNEILTG